MNLLQLASLPFDFKKYLIIGAVGLVALASTYGAGYLIGQRNLSLTEKKETTREVVKWETQLQTQRVEVKVRDVAREQELNKQLQLVTSQRDQLRDVLREKPDPDPSVFMRVGDVRLLDAAADPSTTGVPDTAGVAAYQEQTPSQVNLRKFVETELDVRAQYNELAKRHDALVDWVNVELIQPQLKASK